MEQRICRRCLVKDMPDASYFDNMYEYVRQLDPEIKTEASLYEERLSCCRGCNHLINGLCRICGCFVEMRAAVRKNYCPDIHAKW